MSERDQIYYWKCDRPAAFHSIKQTTGPSALEPSLQAELQRTFPAELVKLSPGNGQGNHLTWKALIGDRDTFIRVEDGPEQDDYLEVESHVLNEVAKLGLPTPQVLAVDATRSLAPFAWQVLENIPHPDLNHHFKQGTLDLRKVAFEIGSAIAQWQGLKPTGFGPFSLHHLRKTGQLVGLHASYSDYFQLNLSKHLAFLTEQGFLSSSESAVILMEIRQHETLLHLQLGCLVHKDLALWNILGSESHIAAFIDWDDSISGDPMDDLSLLACFHSGAVISQAANGYASQRSLPSDHRRRFWLHLLRNMIVKAVIRVGAGYFDRNDSFFLIGAGTSGASLRDFTQARLRVALQGLREDRELDFLP